MDKIRSGIFVIIDGLQCSTSDQVVSTKILLRIAYFGSFANEDKDGGRGPEEVEHREFAHGLKGLGGDRCWFQNIFDFGHGKSRKRWLGEQEDLWSSRLATDASCTMHAVILNLKV